MQILPIMLLFIVTGWVVDHFSRKQVLIACCSLELVVFLGLALHLQGGEIDRVLVFGLLFVNGCAKAFQSPAMDAVLPNIVPADYLSRAVAITSTAWIAANTAGPFVAGLLIAGIDFYTYWILVLLAVVAVAATFQLPTLVIAEKTQRSGHQLLEGIQFVFRNPIVLPSISLDLLIVLTGSVMALLPVFAADVLNVGPEALGLLRAMPALGAVLAGFALTRLPPMRRSGHSLFAALLVFCLSIVVFALSEQLWLSLVALFVYGASDMVSVNVRSTLIQIATPDALRGRVSAVNSLFISTSNDLGDFRAGAAAAGLGAVQAVLVGSVMAFAVTIGGLFVCRQLRDLDRLEDAKYRDDQG